jgi:hypothetical protein
MRWPWASPHRRRSCGRVESPAYAFGGMVFADHLGSGDFAMSYAYVVGVLVLACAGAFAAWRAGHTFTRVAAATTAAALVAVGVECVASWDEVTGAMDLIAGPEGGELRMQHVADLIRESTGSLGVVVLLVATAVMWVVALLYRYRDPEGHVATQ